nr:AMP-binding protein [Pseudomonas sp.]
VDGQGPDAFESLWQTADRTPDPALRPDADAVTQILYTSGTTGEPKGVMHTSNTLLSNLREYVKWLQLGPSDVVLMASPMAHQTGFMYGLMMPVLLRAKAVLLDIWNAPQAADIISSQGVTFTMASAPFLNDLTEVVAAGAPPTDSLRIFLSAGAPIPRALVSKAREVLGAAIVSAWGMTENGVVTLTRPDDPSDKVDSTDGCCLTGLEIKVIDASGQPVAPGEEGELMVRGCSQFAGYLKRPEWNATDADGWFSTGDLAHMTEDGYIRISGRSKDVIIRGGENIPVVEVENLLFRHPAVAAASVVGYPDPRLGERAVAFVVVRPGMSFSFDDMVQFLAQHKLTRQYFPERLEVADELPRTPSGKVQKFKLREMARSFGATASA